MKRCPECGRDYNDDSLSFCLDDGSDLLFGPGSFDEPQTAILHSADLRSQVATRSLIEAGERTEVLENGLNSISKPKQFNWRLVFVPLAIVIVAIAGFWGYGRLNAGSIRVESVAVMPFANENGDADIEYLADGMAETLIKSLSAIPSLSVKSRSAVFFYKGKDATPQKIGEDLGVQAVLLGRVSVLSENLKVSLELVDTRTQDVMWTDQYETSRADVVRLQSKIARDVSTKLREKLTGAEQATVTKAATNDPEAYQAYLRGRYHFNRRTAADLAKAIEAFKRATELDPNYAPAFSGLADTYAIYSDYAGTPGSEFVPLVRLYAERAIALDSQLGEPHATLGILNVQERRWDDALREAKTAVDLNPNYPTGVQWYASILLDLGRYEEAAEMMNRARELDPVSGAISNGLSNTYEVQNNFKAAIDNSLRYIEMNPSFPASYRDLGLYYSKLGRHSEAVANGEKAVALERASYLLGDLGYIYAAAGRRDDALAIVKELNTRYLSNQSAGRYIAAVYSGLGQYENAMEWLEKDFDSKNGRLAEIRWTIPYHSMHEHAPFRSLIKRMGMPEI